MAGTTGMAAMGAVRILNDLYEETDALMPALFIGHGSPMNGIEDNLFSNRWKQLGKELPTPKAVLVVSAHWLTQGTFIKAVEKPQTIHDFGGFPQALFEAQYPAPGAHTSSFVLCASHMLITPPSFTNSSTMH